MCRTIELITDSIYICLCIIVIINRNLKDLRVKKLNNFKLKILIQNKNIFLENIIYNL